MAPGVAEPPDPQLGIADVPADLDGRTAEEHGQWLLA